MSTNCQNAIRSLRECAKMNLRQARDARKLGRTRMADFHIQVALDCRRDAHALR